MAKTLAQGRKPGSGRKPGKAKTLKEGRKPGSGRRKRKDSNPVPVISIPIPNNMNNSNNGNSHLFQSQLNVIPINLQPLNLPSNQNILIPSYNHTTNINHINHINHMNNSLTSNVMNENIHPSSISTRDMVAVDALRELTHSPLSLTPITNISNSNKFTNNKSMDDHVSNTNTNTPVIENLTLPPLNQMFNKTTDKNNNIETQNDKLQQPQSLLSHRNNNNNNGISNIETHYHSSESTMNTTTFGSIENEINNINNTHQHQHQQHNNNNLPHNNIL